MDPTNTQKILLSCLKQPLPVIQIPRLINLQDSRTLGLKFSGQTERTKGITLNKICELCGVHGKVTETKLESEVQGLFPSPSRLERKQAFCRSCNQVIASVSELFQKGCKIKEEFDDTLTGIRTLLSLKDKYSGSNPHAEGICKVENEKCEIKKLRVIPNQDDLHEDNVSTSEERLTPNLETDTSGYNVDESAVEIEHYSVFEQFEVKEEPQDILGVDGSQKVHDGSPLRPKKDGTLRGSAVKPRMEAPFLPLLLLNENGKRLYQCEIRNCNKTFCQEQDLLVHQLIRHQKYSKTFTCYFCGRRVAKKNCFYEHVLRKHVKELPEPCGITGCGFKAPGKEGRRRHLKSKHPKEWKKLQTRTRKKKEYTCTKCPKVFNSSMQFYRHSKTHEKPQPRIQYTCEICAKSFLCRQSLKDHLTLKHGHNGRIFKCPYKECKTPDHPSQYALKQHIRRTHVVENLSCKDCGSKLKNQFALNEHCRRNKSCAQQSGREIALHYCPHCPKSFAQKIVLKRHIEKIHVSKRPYKHEGKEGAINCYFCPYVTDGRQINTLYEHMAGQHLGELPLVCEVQGCGYRTASMGLWKEHLRKYHEAEWEKYQKQRRPTEFRCPHCPKIFNKRVYLRLHAKKHRPDRVWYQCQECEKSFAKKPSLKEHLISRHGKEGTTFPCPYKSCKSKPFPNKNNLNYHIERVHNKEKAVCGHCGRTFKNLISLKEHQQRGKSCAQKTGRILKLFPCSFTNCSKAFSRKSQLELHIACSHTPKSVKQVCNECGAGFGSLTTLGKHLAERHGGVPCEVCGKAFDSWKAYSKHRTRVHANKRRKLIGLKHKLLECYFCKEKLAGYVLLEKHLLSQHLNEK